MPVFKTAPGSFVIRLGDHLEGAGLMPALELLAIGGFIVGSILLIARACDALVSRS